MAENSNKYNASECPFIGMLVIINIVPTRRKIISTKIIRIVNDVDFWIYIMHTNINTINIPALIRCDISALMSSPPQSYEIYYRMEMKMSQI